MEQYVKTSIVSRDSKVTFSFYFRLDTNCFNRFQADLLDQMLGEIKAKREHVEGDVSHLTGYAEQSETANLGAKGFAEQGTGSEFCDRVLAQKGVDVANQRL